MYILYISDNINDDIQTTRFLHRVILDFKEDSNNFYSLKISEITLYPA